MEEGVELANMHGTDQQKTRKDTYDIEVEKYMT
jgi:hypothetical protein